MLIAKCNYCDYSAVNSKSHIELHIVRDYIRSFDLDTSIVFVSSCGQSWTLKYAINQPYPLTPMIIDRQQDKAEVAYFIYPTRMRSSRFAAKHCFAQLAETLRQDVRSKYRLKQQ